VVVSVVTGRIAVTVVAMVTALAHELLVLANQHRLIVVGWNVGVWFDTLLLTHFLYCAFTALHIDFGNIS